ncbi:MAG: endonuclease domain-containing protein [Thermoanaerobaculia bacterium]
MKRKQSFDSSPRDLWMRLKSVARDFRRKPTRAEELLWNSLRRGQLGGYKFRRQFAIGQFLVDFCCWQRRLVIELDGEIHLQAGARDAERQRFIETAGFSVLRFTNDEVRDDRERVLEKILELLELKNES